MLSVVLPSPSPGTPALLLLCSRLRCREQPQGILRLIFTRYSSFCSTPVWPQSFSDWGEQRKLLTASVSAPPRGGSQGKECKDAKAVLASVPAFSLYVLGGWRPTLTGHHKSSCNYKPGKNLTFTAWSKSKVGSQADKVRKALPFILEKGTTGAPATTLPQKKKA